MNPELPWDEIKDALAALEHINLEGCQDCGERLWSRGGKCRGYMVKDEVWAAAGMGYSGYLCLECLGKRLGRDVGLDDLTDVPLNDWLREKLS